MTAFMEYCELLLVRSHHVRNSPKVLQLALLMDVDSFNSFSKNAAIASTSISQIPEILARCAALNIQAPFLVLDNCRIHHSDEVVALFTFHGVDLLYLPPYSPDFNPIENSFSKFKLMLKRHGEFLNSAGYSDYEIIDAAFEFITSSDCANWIRHAGY